MHISNQDYNAIKLNYEDNIRENRSKYNLMKEKIYNENPSLLSLEDELRSLVVKKVKASHNNENISDIKKRMNEINKEMTAILSKYDLSMERFNKFILCEKCNDTGYIGNKMCTCFKRFVLDYTYKNSNLKEKFKTENFNTFKLDYYSDEKAPNMPFSPRDYAKICLGASKDFCLNFKDKINVNNEEKFNLLFYGMPGLGKTFLCNSIAKEILDKCYSVVYYSACDLSKIVIGNAFNHGQDSDEELTCASLNVYDCDLLILDDLGTEANNSIFISELFNIINSRSIAHRPTIISTNLDMNDLRDKYTERISSRFIESYEIFKFIGRNIRELKNI